MRSARSARGRNLAKLDLGDRELSVLRLISASSPHLEAEVANGANEAQTGAIMKTAHVKTRAQHTWSPWSGGDWEATGKNRDAVTEATANCRAASALLMSTSIYTQLFDGERSGRRRSTRQVRALTIELEKAKHRTRNVCRSNSAARVTHTPGNVWLVCVPASRPFTTTSR